MPVRSLPMAETARCCFIASEVTIYSGSVPGLARVANARRRARLTCLRSARARNIARPRLGLKRLNCNKLDGSLAQMFSGSLVAIVTPMHPDGAIDWAAWERLLAWHLDAGTSGIVVGGTTGESVTLTDADLLALIERARAKLSGRATLLAGAGSSSTALSIERAQRLSGAGV